MIEVSISVALSTFNGEKYLYPFLESLAGQTLPVKFLVVRDDCSSDRTIEILESSEDAFPWELRLIKGTKRLGAKHSFSKVLTAALLTETTYIALADQDDYWLPDKLYYAIELITSLEERDVNHTNSILYCSDLTVVRHNLQISSKSFKNTNGINPRLKDFQHALFTNIATGCTIVCNRQLLEQALPIPSNAVMHDWWLFLLASYCGEVIYDNRSQILYRQHQANLIGSKNAFHRHINSILSLHKLHSRLSNTITQYSAVCKKLSIKTAVPLIDFSGSGLELLSVLIRGGYIRKHNIMKTIVTNLIFLLFMIRKK